MAAGDDRGMYERAFKVEPRRLSYARMGVVSGDVRRYDVFFCLILGPHV